MAAERSGGDERVRKYSLRSLIAAIRRMEPEKGVAGDHGRIHRPCRRNHIPLPLTSSLYCVPCNFFPSPTHTHTHTHTHTRAFLVKQSSGSENLAQVPGHDRRHILPYIVGEDEHDDELPDEEPAFLPVE